MPDSPSQALDGLPDKLERNDILALLLKFGFQAVFSKYDQDKTPVYYEKQGMYLLPLAADNERYQVLPSIEAVLTKAFQANANILTQNFWIPVLEMQRGKQPSFWVLLMYEPNPNGPASLTMIDPTGKNRAVFFPYSTTPMLDQFKKAIAGKNVTLNSMQLDYLGVQDFYDSISGGYWITYFIYKLSGGETFNNTKDVVKKTSLITIKEVFEKLCLPPCTDMEIPPALSMSSNALPVNVEKQIYASTQNEVSFSKGLAASPTFNQDPNDFVPEYSKNISGSWNYFRLNFYSTLILSGTILALVGLFCLSSPISMLSSTHAAGLTGVGIITFIAGLLGKCGLFDNKAGAKSDQPIVRDDNSIVQQL
ncbi:MAG TPA: hypothetical protein VHD33_03065 [Legionellaceae bacterium]|nr:hypothetical protein [Legionellaceae bacterium]